MSTSTVEEEESDFQLLDRRLPIRSTLSASLAQNTGPNTAISVFAAAICASVASTANADAVRVRCTTSTMGHGASDKLFIRPSEHVRDG